MGGRRQRQVVNAPFIGIGWLGGHLSFLIGEMSSFEDDDGPFKGNSSESGEEPFKTPVKNVRFGIVELCIFMGLWIVMIVIFKLYTKSQSKSKKGLWRV